MLGVVAADVAVVKIGGSAISDKCRPFSIKHDVLRAICDDIVEYVKSGGKVVIIHGGGSFGHPLASKCLKEFGVINDRCFSVITRAMNIMNIIITSEFINRGINAVSIPPHAVCSYDGRKYLCDLSIVRSYLKHSLIPVTYGDVVVNISEANHKVISGDYLAWILTKELNARKLIFVTDVGGLYTEDPKKNPNASLIKCLSAKELSRLRLGSRASGFDVTGGMAYKLLLGVELGVSNVEVLILSPYEKKNLYNALVGREFKGSIVWY